MIDGVIGVLLGIVVSLALTWLVFLVLLLLWRPAGVDLREARRLVPDIVRLVRAIGADETVSKAARRKLGFLVAYLALPFDVVPDFIPVLGYADDVVLIGAVLRSVVRRAGPEAILRHWTGTPTGLAIVAKLSGLAVPQDFA